MTHELKNPLTSILGHVEILQDAAPSAPQLGRSVTSISRAARRMESLVASLLTIPVVILAESFLSFLGLGVNEPLTSLGVLISDGAHRMEEKPWMLLAPAVTMAVTLLCLNFIGDGLRDALDPKDR